MVQEWPRVAEVMVEPQLLQNQLPVGRMGTGSEGVPEDAPAPSTHMDEVGKTKFNGRAAFYYTSDQ
jgi:hypothetical protein